MRASHTWWLLWYSRKSITRYKRHVNQISCHKFHNVFVRGRHSTAGISCNWFTAFCGWCRRVDNVWHKTRSSAVAERVHGALRVTQGHSRSLKMTPFDRSHTSSYWRSKVDRILYCFWDKRYWSKIAIFHTSPAFDASVGSLDSLPVSILP